MKEGFLSRGRSTAPAESSENLDDRAKKILERVNIAEIETIFQEEQRRSGVEQRKIDAEIMLVHGTDDRGTWDGSKNVIEVNAKGVDKVIGLQKKEGMAVDFESGIISVLMHELSHAMAHNKHMEIDSFDRIKAYFSKRERTDENGYGVWDLKSSNFYTRFALFSEGVTDLLAEEVFNEYKKRTADPDLKGMEYSLGYLGQRALLEAFMLHVGDAAGVSKDEVWKAIKQGYFSGLDLESNELGELYEEYALTEIMERIKYLNGEYDSETVQPIKELYTRSVLAPIDEPSRKRIMRGLQRLQR